MVALMCISLLIKSDAFVLMKLSHMLHCIRKYQDLYVSLQVTILNSMGVTGKFRDKVLDLLCRCCVCSE